MDLAGGWLREQFYLGTEKTQLRPTPYYTREEAWLVRTQDLTAKTIHELTQVTKGIY